MEGTVLLMRFGNVWSNIRLAYHQSIVVVDKKPSPCTLREYLFHLRHAYGQKNRPPPTADGASSEPDDQVSSSHISLDKVLVPRMNRYIGISREGIACMTWTTEYPTDACFCCVVTFSVHKFAF